MSGVTVVLASRSAERLEDAAGRIPPCGERIAVRELGLTLTEACVHLALLHSPDLTATRVVDRPA